MSTQTLSDIDRQDESGGMSPAGQATGLADGAREKAGPTYGAEEHERRTPTEADIRRAVDLFKVLAHPDRLRLACHLGDGRVTTQKELMEEFGWPQSTTARHLAILRNAGLVSARRDGTEVLLRLGNRVGLHLMDTVCAWVHDGSSAEDERSEALGGTLVNTSVRSLADDPPQGGVSSVEGAR